MTKEHAQKLQERMTKEAIALLVATGHAADTTPYEKAVALIGKAWSIPAEDTQARLDLIRLEKELPGDTAEAEQEHAYPEEQLPINATGLETLENVWGLFETAVRLAGPEDRTTPPTSPTRKSCP